MVFGEIKFIGETQYLLAVNKPSSIPMHPCGSYRFNSLEYILRNEPIIPNQPFFHIVHRLDRLTSGLIVLAKNKFTAAKVSEEIRSKNTEKVSL
jgi:23S rRNA-/tRNA-specific pseudouridylate synthase